MSSFICFNSWQKNDLNFLYDFDGERMHIINRLGTSADHLKDVSRHRARDPLDKVTNKVTATEISRTKDKNAGSIGNFLVTGNYLAEQPQSFAEGGNLRSSKNFCCGYGLLLKTVLQKSEIFSQLVGQILSYPIPSVLLFRIVRIYLYIKYLGVFYM